LAGASLAFPKHRVNSSVDTVPCLSEVQLKRPLSKAVIIRGMYILLADESNRNPSDRITFFIYGGIIVPLAECLNIHE